MSLTYLYRDAFLRNGRELSCYQVTLHCKDAKNAYSFKPSSKVFVEWVSLLLQIGGDLFEIGKFLLFQIGAEINTNQDNYYKPEQLLKIGAQQLLLICQVINELMMLL